MAGNGATRGTLLAALALPLIDIFRLAEPAFQDRTIGLNPLPGRGEAEVVEAAERIEIGVMKVARDIPGRGRTPTAMWSASTAPWPTAGPMPAATPPRPAS